MTPNINNSQLNAPTLQHITGSNSWLFFNSNIKKYKCNAKMVHSVYSIVKCNTYAWGGILFTSILGLTTAFILGFFIGLERQYRQRTAGLRTHVLVTLGAAIFVNLAKSIDTDEGAVKVIAYVVSGIGFLGAGVIMRQDGGVQGLNTSATIWCSGAVGAAAGSNMYLIAIISTIFILAINVLLRPVVNFIDRKPVNGQTEITHNINIITDVKNSKKVIEKIRAVLAMKNIQMLDFSINSFGNHEVIIKAILNVTSITPEEMNAILDKLNSDNEVEYAFCSLM